MRRPVLLIALLAVSAEAQATPARLDEAAVRAFVERQDRAWNAGDLGAFFATYAPDAIFVSQARNSQNGVTPFGRSTLPQARAQARRTFARGHVSQQTRIDRIAIAPDGRTAQLHAQQTTRSIADGQVRVLCGEVDQVLALVGGRILSRRETDTAVRCRR
jgi:uncharacterized protein (TIGR02246 family)